MDFMVVLLIQLLIVNTATSINEIQLSVPA
jgi:hypothetical protein